MKPRHTPVESATYTCPMHPDVQRDKPGKCPKCGMDLVPKSRAGPSHQMPGQREMKPHEGDGDDSHKKAEQEEHGAMPEREIYTCPMHPEVEQNKPGKCPKCGMDLVPKSKAHKMGRHGAMPEMTRDMRRHWLWTNSTLIMLGLWLVSSPFAFGYDSNTKLMWNEVVSGILLTAFAIAAFAPRFDFIGRWGAAIVGTWLQFAPLVFWATSPVALRRKLSSVRSPLRFRFSCR